MIRQLFLSIISLFAVVWSASAAVPSYNDAYVVEHISSLKGLSQNHVNAMLQDSDGFMWIATNDGLNRYDGLNFKIYNTGDLGLESNLILTLHEDKYRNIWIGTADKGIYCYVKSQHRFFHYSQMTSGEVNVPKVNPIAKSILSDGETVWIVPKNTQVAYCLALSNANSQINEVRKYVLDGASSKTPSTSAMVRGVLYISKAGVIYKFDKEEDQFVVDEELTGERSRTVSSYGDKLLINKYADFSIYDCLTEKLTHYVVSPWNRFNCWVGDDMWYANQRGLFVTHYNRYSDKFSQPVKVDSYELQNITAICTDRSGGVWVALASAGIRRYERNNKPFKHTAPIGNNLILSATQCSNGKIWISTEGSGTFMLDSLDAPRPSLNILKNGNVYDVAYCNYDDQYYITTGVKLHSYSEKTKRVEHFDWTRNYVIRKIHVQDEYLWLATYGNGLLRYNLADKRVAYLNEKSGLPSRIVRNIMRDKRGYMWLCTSNGLATISPDQQLAAQPRVERLALGAQAKNHVISILETTRGDIWYGTLGHGVGKLTYNAATDKFEQIEHYTTRNGLPNNSAKSMVEEPETGAVWVSTNRGLGRINPRNGQISSYNIYDGLLEYEFSELSSMRLRSGELVFGGVKGVNYIDPNGLKTDITSIIPKVTDIRLFDRSIYEDDDLAHLIPSRGEELRLAHNQNTFTIEYVGIHYSNPTRNRCQYRLEGVDEGWIETVGRKNTVTYKNLEPGRYTFYLKAANCDGVWSEKVYTQEITIDPPVWATWYSYLIYLLVIVAVLYYAFRQYHGEMKRRRAVAIANFEKQKMEEMLAARTQFFTNVSHEFRTPLTLILSPLQRLMREREIAENPRWSGYLQTMHHNGESLMRLINEFLSYSKEESGKLTVEISVGDVEAAGQRLFKQFEPWAEQKGITLEYISARIPVMVEYDPYLIEQIINNLLSNAIKNTEAGGRITLSLTEESANVVVAIKDSGVGIAPEKQPHIFERFYSQGSSGSTGIGLYLTKSLVEIHSGEIWFESAQGAGTTFFVKLPKVQSVPEAIVGGESQEVAQEVSVEVSQDVAEGEAMVDAQPSLIIIDDNADLRNLISELFAESYTVVTAVDGEDGWMKILAVMPDIIISDIMMPRLSGLELCERVKGDSRTSHIPLLLLSAKSTEEDIAEGYRSQADGYCPKPFSNEILVQSVNSILHNRQLLAKRFNATFSAQGGENAQHHAEDDDVTTNTDKLFIKRISEFIERNIHNPDLMVNDLCNYMGVTPLVLNKKLKSILNLTANALIRSIRLKRAAQLLKSGRYTIADVTYDVGFSDLRYFRECFKKEFGVLPNEYKDKYTSGE
ncbi:MAG: ATP-binding protein [Rikenellaceae bacterium]